MTSYFYSLLVNFPNHIVSSVLLVQQIQASAIATSVDRVEVNGDSVLVWFKASLSAPDISILNALVAAHTGILSVQLANVTIYPQTAKVLNAYTTTSGSTFTPIRATTFAESLVLQARSIKSTSGVDTNSAGTGARSVIITYYDDTLNGPYTETINLNGTTAVNTAATNICFVESLYVVTVGSQLGNVGAISLYDTTGGTGTIMAQIAASDNQTFYAHHYVGLSRTAKISDLSGTISGLNGGMVSIRTVNPTLVTAPELTTAVLIHFNPGENTEYVPVIPTTVVGPARILAYAKADGTPALMTWFIGLSFYEANT